MHEILAKAQARNRHELAAQLFGLQWVKEHTIAPSRANRAKGRCPSTGPASTLASIGRMYSCNPILFTSARKGEGLATRGVHV